MIIKPTIQEEIDLAETLAAWFVENLSGFFSREVIVAIVSMLPILELRGGIIAGFAMGMEWLPTFIIAYIANLIPIPFILLFIRKIFAWMKQVRWLKKWIEKLENKTRKKGARIQKGWLIGLIIFVGIPLPGTGAWTGAIISAILDLPKRKAIPAVFLGLIMSASIMGIISYALPDLFVAWFVK